MSRLALAGQRAGGWLLLAGYVVTAGACTRTDPAPSPTPPAASRSAPGWPSSAPSATAAAASTPLTSATQPSPENAPTHYDWQRTHSPLSRSVLVELRKIRARSPQAKPDVFAKVGDSLTASGDFLYCLGTDRIEWAEHAPLQATFELFRNGNAGGTDPFRRDSLAAHVGWSAWVVLHGTAPPLVREVDAIEPSLALVMFGTNDIEIGKVFFYADQMLDIVDRLVERGVVPILFTIPPRRDRTQAALEVPRYNAMVRALAQARQVPLVDYHRELSKLPDQGLTRDGIHPTTFRGARGRDACNLSPQGLRRGFNLRNLLALEALDRVSRGLDGSLTPDPDGPPLVGTGSESDPVIVPGLPFVDSRRLHQLPDVGDDGGHHADLSPAGPRLVYQLEIGRPTRLRAMGLDRGGAEVDLLLYGSAPTSDQPARHPRLITATLSPGTYRLVMAQTTNTAVTSDAEYVLVLMEE